MVLLSAVLSAMGGVALGFGLGHLAARRHAARDATAHREARRALHVELRRSVLPVLEAHAQELGVAVPDEPSLSADPERRLVQLGGLLREQHMKGLPFTDTLPLPPEGGPAPE